jgi:H+/gluconate symporter-like permease
MTESPATEPKEERVFSFTWYHREEIQVLVILVGLIGFFARSFWVLGTLAAFVVGLLLLLYIVRILERYLGKHKKLLTLLKKYQDLKSALHGHSVERSRIAMALLAAWVLGVLCLHRINLARQSPADSTPTDIYWILFLGWYCIICTISAAYLVWLWNAWSQNESRHIPFLDGLVASLFFYHGLPKKSRIITYVAAFFLGGIPSYVAIRLSPQTPYGYEIACGLVVPLITLILGGAVYAMVRLRNNKTSNESENGHSDQ